MRSFFLVLLLPSLLSGKAQESGQNTLLINEVLFNPIKDGFDYVEGYNHSDHAIDLGLIKIARRNSVGEVDDSRRLAKDLVFVPPEGYFVATANEKWLRLHYTVPDKAIICQVPSMPSFPDDEGTVILLDQSDSIIDELHYNRKWHSPLLSDPSGVALERISFDAPTQDKNNWASAASSTGYGTPGRENSQSWRNPQTDREVNIPRLFSPDNDGVDDFALILYDMKEPGYIVNTIIYDLSGRKVRYLVKNASLGLSAQYKWDGTDEMGNSLAQGIYVVVTELFNPNGKTKKFKNAIILARR